MVARSAGLRHGMCWIFSETRLAHLNLLQSAYSLISTRLQPGETFAEKMETVSTVFRIRSHKAVETAWSRIASTHRAEARC